MQGGEDTRPDMDKSKARVPRGCLSWHNMKKICFLLRGATMGSEELF